MTDLNRHCIFSLALLCALINAPLCSLASATEQKIEDIYHLELLIFRHAENAQQEIEQWPRSHHLHYPEQLIFLRPPPTLDEHIFLPVGDAHELQLDFSLPSPQRHLWWPFPDREQEIARTQPLEDPALLVEQAGPLGDSGQETIADAVEGPADPVTLMESLDKPSSALAAIAEKLPSGSQILFHQQWHQQLGSRDEAPAMVVAGGREYGQHHELEGSISFSKQRFLHLEANLWLSEYLELNAEGGPITAQAEAAPPLLLTMQLPESPEPPQPLRRSVERAGGAAAQDSAKIYRAKRIVQLQQHRKLRSGEIHYLDHPWLGIIVQISKYQPKLHPVEAPQ